MATKKTSAKKSSRSTKGKNTIRRVMEEHKEGKLKSGGRRKVTNRKQAIAIALSEARREGANIPAKKKGARKSTGKKKSTTNKSSTKKKSTSRGKTTKRSSKKKAA